MSPGPDPPPVSPKRPVVCYVTDRKSLPAGDSPEFIARLLDSIRAAARAGADWIQIREKDLHGGQLLRLVRDAQAAAQESGTHIYVNGRLDVAVAARAHGVHLGGEALPVADVVRWRRGGQVPHHFRIGVSCHSVEEAKEAERDGSDYIFFGPIFDTPSKRRFGSPQGIERLADVCTSVRIPVIAIGGVNETNAEDCVRAGASGIAAIRLFHGTSGSESLRHLVSRLKRSAAK